MSDDELLRPYQRLALEALKHGELSADTLAKMGIMADEAHQVRAESFRRYPKLQGLLDAKAAAEREPFTECRRKWEYRLLKEGTPVQELKATEAGTEIHEAIETLLRHGLVLTEPNLGEREHMVGIAMRLALLQDTDVDPDVLGFLLKAGIKDFRNPPPEWRTVTWQGRVHLLRELEDDDGVITAFGLYLDWPAKYPDEDDDDNPRYDLSPGPRS